MLPFLLGPVDSVFIIYSIFGDTLLELRKKVRLIVSKVWFCYVLIFIALLVFKVLTYLSLMDDRNFRTISVMNARKMEEYRREISKFYILSIIIIIIIIIISIKLSQKRLAEHEARKHAVNCFQNSTLRNHLA